MNRRKLLQKIKMLLLTFRIITPFLIFGFLLFNAELLNTSTFDLNLLFQ